MIVTSTPQQMQELFFSWVFAHRHGSSCVRDCMENECVPILWGKVHVQRPRGGQGHAGRHRKGDSSVQVDSSGHGTLKTFYTKVRESHLPFWHSLPHELKFLRHGDLVTTLGPDKEICDSIKIIPYLTQCTQVLGLIDLPLKTSNHPAWCPLCFGKEGCHKGPQS